MVMEFKANTSKYTQETKKWYIWRNDQGEELRTAFKPLNPEFHKLGYKLISVIDYSVDEREMKVGGH